MLEVSVGGTLLGLLSDLSEEVIGNRIAVFDQLAPPREQEQAIEASPFYVDRLARYENVCPTPQAIEFCEKRIAELQRSLDGEENPMTQQGLYAELGDAYGKIGRLKEARSAYERADAIVVEINANM